MKVLVCLVLAICAVSALPRKLQDNWAFVPDGDGRMHLVDLTAAVEPEGRFNAASDVIFRVFTPNNAGTGQIIGLNNAGSLSSSNFNSAWPTRLIIHGWNNHGGSPVNNNIRTAFLQRGAFNVITVDWGAGAQTANYVAARNRVNDVGAVVAQFVDFLNLSGGAAFGNINIVGHSLGAHTAGIAGKRVSRGTIRAIHGLDPALPLFSMGAPNERLNHNDAAYTETFHTNAGLLGFDQPITQASFYPNWGSTQPGCGIDAVGNCAHSRAWEFFTESINSGPGFWARQCRNFADITNRNCVSAGANRLMGGEPTAAVANGVYWLETNGNSPFARGQM